MEKVKFIKLSAAKKREIAKKFDVSLVTVCSALAFKTQSAKAITLRAAALNNGGKLLSEEPAKEVVVL